MTGVLVNERVAAMNREKPLFSLRPWKARSTANLSFRSRRPICLGYQAGAECALKLFRGAQNDPKAVSCFRTNCIVMVSVELEGTSHGLPRVSNSNVFPRSFVLAFRRTHT
jgi:hypothetical protein